MRPDEHGAEGGLDDQHLFGRAGGLSADGSVQLAPGEKAGGFGSALAALPVRGGPNDDLLVGAPGFDVRPWHAIGALYAYPTGPSGPDPSNVRRWRPDDPELAGDVVSGETMGRAIG